MKSNLQSYFIAKYSNVAQAYNIDPIVNILKQHEGWKPTPYKDRNTISVGYGFNTKEPLIRNLFKSLNYNVNNPMTEKQGDTLLRRVINQSTLPELRKIYTKFDSFPSSVKDALINMHYNMGSAKLRNFKNMNAAINKNDWATAAREAFNSNWRKQVKDNRASWVVNRLSNDKNNIGLGAKSPLYQSFKFPKPNIVNKQPAPVVKNIKQVKPIKRVK